MSVNERLIEVDFSPDYHIPPPAFGSFVKIEDAGCAWFGLVYNAVMITDESQVTPVSMEQAPGQSGNHHFRTNHLFKTQLQIILIGQTIGRRFSVQIKSLPEIFQDSFFPDENEIRSIAMNLDFISSISGYDNRIPSENLILTVLRRMMTTHDDLLTVHTQNTLKQMQSENYLLLNQFYVNFITEHSGER